MKKAQGLSMNVIIIAAIALIVLIVVILIFTGKIRTFSGESDSCTSRGGSCEMECELDCEAPTRSDECTQLGKNVCCIDFRENCLGDDPG